MNYSLSLQLLLELYKIIKMGQENSWVMGQVGPILYRFYCRPNDPGSLYNAVGQNE
jgi:hypothetical protein